MPNQIYTSFDGDDGRDEYQRKPIAERVYKLLISGVRVSPMVIDGGWGTGKTEFCHKLKHYIETNNADYKTVYVDAFRADHADEPMMTLMAAVIKIMPKKDQVSLKKMAIPAIRFGMKTLAKASIGWLLKQDADGVLKDYEDELKAAGDEAVNMAVESALNDHLEFEKSIQSFRDKLKSLTVKNKLIIFVDELDRCRPNFAVSMLESIKHVFDVDGVQFVLVANMNQLKASINHCYGDLIDAQRYLDKFLSYSFMLPDKFGLNSHELSIASLEHFKLLVRKSETLSQSVINNDTSFELIKILIVKNRLSLREVETLVRHMELYQVLTDEEGLKAGILVGTGYLRILAIYIFCFKPEIVHDLNHEKSIIKQFAAIFGREKIQVAKTQNINDEEALIIMIALDLPEHDSDFSPSTAEVRDAWESAASEYFNRRPKATTGNKIRIIESVFNVLKLLKKI